MKALRLLFLVILFPALGFTQPVRPPLVDMDTLSVQTLPTLKHEAFQAGEYLRFRLHYGLIDAGEAELTVHGTSKKFNGREAYHIIGTGKTLGAFNWFFKVRDRYETYLDKQGSFPWMFVRDVKEGGYTKQQTYAFYQHKGAVKTNKGETFQIPVASQDMLSSFYFARTLDFTNAVEGQLYTIPTFVDEETFPLMIKFLGREEIKSRTGTYKCLKFVPVVQEGRIFKEEEDMIVWITDDKNKIPVLAKAKVLVGSIKMELVEYGNLANPVALVD